VSRDILQGHHYSPGVVVGRKSSESLFLTDYFVKAFCFIIWFITIWRKKNKMITYQSYSAHHLLSRCSGELRNLTTTLMPFLPSKKTNFYLIKTTKAPVCYLNIHRLQNLVQTKKLYTKKTKFPKESPRYTNILPRFVSSLRINLELMKITIKKFYFLNLLCI